MVILVPSGADCWACKAAKSPAPPVPRIRISVSCLSISVVISYRIQEKRARNQHSHPNRTRGKGLLGVTPRQKLQRQKPQPTKQVNRQQKDKPEFRQLDQGLLGQLQETVQLTRGRDGLGQNPEMHRQEQRQAKPRHPVQHEGQPKRMCARRGLHAKVTAQTDRPPINNRPSATTHVKACKTPPFRPNHSCTITRRPMAAWTDTASTKSP